MIVLRDRRRNTIVSTGILIAETHDELVLGHNFIGSEVVDLTHIKKKDISLVSHVSVKEVE